ncbi:MAG: RNA 2',3'-cyclic phosphodiesterase [Chloroflexota bacterium]
MRTFTAIAFPDSVKAALADLCKVNIPTARWVHPDDFHITLRFIGSADDATLQRYRAALKTIKAAPFDLCIKGAGRFPENPSRPPTVLWVDIVKTPELLALHAAVSDVLRAEGLPDDRYPDYNPHITLARLKTPRQLAEVDNFITQHTHFELPPFRVQGVTLYESRRNAKGGSYTPVEVYPLM